MSASIDSSPGAVYRRLWGYTNFPVGESLDFSAATIGFDQLREGGRSLAVEVPLDHLIAVDRL